MSPSCPATLTVIGHAPAGGAFAGAVGAGEAVRIFTGAPVPTGADAIVIQEDTEAEGDDRARRRRRRADRALHPPCRARLHSRASRCSQAGRVLTARDIGLAAAMNRAVAARCAASRASRSSRPATSW